jgi:hypothetical protein
MANTLIRRTILLAAICSLISSSVTTVRLLRAKNTEAETDSEADADFCYVPLDNEMNAKSEAEAGIKAFHEGDAEGIVRYTDVDLLYGKEAECEDELIGLVEESIAVWGEEEHITDDVCYTFSHYDITLGDMETVSEEELGEYGELLNGVLQGGEKECYSIDYGYRIACTLADPCGDGEQMEGVVYMFAMDGKWKLDVCLFAKR